MEHGINKNPTSKDLRSFGLIMGGMISVFFGLLIPWIWDLKWPMWPFIVAAAFVLVALAAPKLLTPIYHVWMKIGQVLGFINTRIILGLVFFTIFFPFALALKLLGKDPMARKLDAKIKSYRVKSKLPDADHLRRPY